MRAHLVSLRARAQSQAGPAECGEGIQARLFQNLRAVAAFDKIDAHSTLLALWKEVLGEGEQDGSDDDPDDSDDDEGEVDEDDDGT